MNIQDEMWAQVASAGVSCFPAIFYFFSHNTLTFQSTIVTFYQLLCSLSLYPPHHTPIFSFQFYELPTHPPFVFFPPSHSLLSLSVTIGRVSRAVRDMRRERDREMRGRWWNGCKQSTVPCETDKNKLFYPTFCPFFFLCHDCRAWGELSKCLWRKSRNTSEQYAVHGCSVFVKHGCV